MTGLRVMRSAAEDEPPALLPSRRKTVPSRGPLLAVEEPKAEGSIPSWRYLGIVWGNSPGCFISYQCPAHVSSDPPAVPTTATDPRR